MTKLLRQSLRFAVVGIVNTMIGLTIIYALMFFFSVRPVMANASGYAFGLAVSFALNRVWTFSSNLPVAHLMPKYLLVAAISYLFNLGVVLVTTSYFFVNPYLAQLLGVGFYTACMFFGCRQFVFTQQKSTS